MPIIRNTPEQSYTNLLIISLFLTGNRAAEPFLGCAVFYDLLRFVQKFIRNDIEGDAHIAPYAKIKRCAKDVTQ